MKPELSRKLDEELRAKQEKEQSQPKGGSYVMATGKECTAPLSDFCSPEETYPDCIHCKYYTPSQVKQPIKRSEIEPDDCMVNCNGPDCKGCKRYQPWEQPTEGKTVSEILRDFRRFFNERYKDNPEAWKIEILNVDISDFIRNTPISSKQINK